MLQTTRDRVAVASALVLVIIVALVVSPSSGSTTLTLPPPGQVSADAVGDLPVFVVHATDGDVYVLNARSPHDVFPKMLAWSRPAAVFEDLWHGSIFDPAGRWIEGPAPTDMASYPILDLNPEPGPCRRTGVCSGPIHRSVRHPGAGRP